MWDYWSLHRRQNLTLKKDQVLKSSFLPCQGVKITLRSVDLKTRLSSQKLVSKNKWMNMFFYPDDSYFILETWISIWSFKYFWVIRIQKQICSFFCVCEVKAQHFCFKIYRPIVWYGKKDDFLIGSFLSCGNRTKLFR